MALSSTHANVLTTAGAIRVRSRGPGLSAAPSGFLPCRLRTQRDNYDNVLFARGNNRASISLTSVRRRGATRLAASASSNHSHGQRDARAGCDDDGCDLDGERDGRRAFDPLHDVFNYPARSAHASSSSRVEPKQPWWKAPAAAFTIAAIMLAVPLDAQAARSGGRMGGGSFRAAPSMSRGYSGGHSGGGGGMGGAMMAPRGAGVGVAPMRSVIMPVPMGGFGYGFGGPMMFMGGGGGIITLAFTAIFVLFFIDSIKNMFGGDSGVQLGGDRIAVVKIQIGLLGMARDLQLDLEKIADKADTSSPEGLHYVLEETVLSLLRNPEYCVYGGGLRAV